MANCISGRLRSRFRFDAPGVLCGYVGLSAMFCWLWYLIKFRRAVSVLSNSRRRSGKGSVENIFSRNTPVKSVCAAMEEFPLNFGSEAFTLIEVRRLWVEFAAGVEVEAAPCVVEHPGLGSAGWPLLSLFTVPGP